MTRATIEEWIYLFNSDFDDRWQSVMKNLESITDQEWKVVLVGGVRSIRDIVAHIGMFKYMYPAAAFREREFGYGGEPATPHESRLATTGAAIEWL
jgi:hypothetical protein